jgi:hypothetical protein
MTDAEERRLDGNGAAGLMREVFAADMTGATGACDHCGTIQPLGRAHVYGGGPGTVMRCSACEGVLMRFARLEDRLLVEVGGVRWFEVAPKATS